jgi:hypothetical protein
MKTDTTKRRGSNLNADEKNLISFAGDTSREFDEDRGLDDLPENISRELGVPAGREVLPARRPAGRGIHGGLHRQRG